MYNVYKGLQIVTKIQLKKLRTIAKTLSFAMRLF